MTASPRPDPAAFRELRRALTRRRLAGAGARFGAAGLAIVAILGAFTYWRVRVPLDGLVRNRGADAAAAALAGELAAFALAGAFTAGARMAVLLRRRPGPEWLALPVPPALVGAHLAAEARLLAMLGLPFAAAALLAGAGLLAPWRLALLAAAFALAWRLAAGVAAALVRHGVRPARDAERALPRETTWLVAEPRRRARRRRGTVTWRAEGPARALARVDALATLRGTPARARLATGAVFVLAGLLAWFDGAEPVLRRAQAFVFFLPAAVALGAWAIHRACAEPADLQRPLPLGLRAAWRARALPMALALAATGVLNAAAATGLPPAARLALVPAWALTGGAVAILGLHHGLTLVPRADAAEAVYLAWLGAAIVASLMIPLLGWAVLLAGLVHASLRLRRWWAPEWAR